jgi:exosortase A-associated hydrolase 1
MGSHMRRLIAFDCDGAELVGTLDEGSSDRGYLFATGGAQTRVGPHRLYERLAHALSRQGHPVFRFDRRGIGDSTGEDAGFLASGDDLAAALAAFRNACPALRQVEGFGLCDGATALALNQQRLGLSRLVLANPWVIEPIDDLPPAAAIASTYRARALDPAAWKRVLTGGIDYRKAARGVWRLVGRREDRSLAVDLVRALASSPAPLSVVLCTGDGTAQAFAEVWRSKLPRGLKDRARVTEVASGSHTFSGPADLDSLLKVLTEA